MAMLDPEKVLSDFIEAWSAGRRPDVDEHLERVAPEQRATLAQDIGTWLAVAPAPRFDKPTRERIRAEPLVRAVVEATDSEGGLWPALLPRLRERAGLSVQEIAGRIAAAFGLAGQEERAAGYV
jgi:hypothetical protein